MFLKHISFKNVPCLSVCPCLCKKYNLHGMKFYYAGATMPDDSTDVYPFKRTRRPVAHRGEKNFHKTVTFDHQLSSNCSANLLDLCVSPSL